MDHPVRGRLSNHRRPLCDATLRANEDRRPRHAADKFGPKYTSTPSRLPLPHNEFLVPNGTLAVRHEYQPSPQHNRISAVIEETRPRNTKRDSEISQTSTILSAGGRRKTHIGPWQLGKTVGRGGCSRVRVVRHSVTQQRGAAKIISKSTAEKVRALSLANLVESAQYDATLFAGGRIIPFGLEREICIMKLLDHPHIVKLYDIWENRNELYLIMEYVEGGELFSFIGERGERGGIPEIQVVHIFRQIIAALWYCHQINIFHRDLKPENILLDRDTMRIKLVDFGMAALQPQGKKLTTPCGSPHYAAPEVIESKSYDGGKADVWSCGVILYVLLTGTPPFNYDGDEGNLAPLFHAITRADYSMPSNISPEAKRLIARILVANPKNRITIEQIWDHPFMCKYDRELGFERNEDTKYQWIRPKLPLHEWKPLSWGTIDREILRYMRTLWHSEKEEVIVDRLLNDDLEAQEKYFYAALQKYRDEEAENYLPSPHHGITYSNSDHHHNHRVPPTNEDVQQLPHRKHGRNQSGYSILNDEHLYSKHSFYESPSSHLSYDPFRASREPVLPNHELHQNITVHRGASNGSRMTRPATALGHRTGSSLRIQALTNSKRGSTLTHASSKRSTPSQRSGPSHRTEYYRHNSRSSLASSYFPSSPPVIVRPGGLGKRGVSFSHLRRPSMATETSADTANGRFTPEQLKHASSGRDSYESSVRTPRPSIVGDSPRPLPKTPRSKTVAVPVVVRSGPRKPDSPSRYIQSEARKVSTELEKVMEEAFNRSSVSSSIRTLATEPRKDTFETPPTLMSNRDSAGTVLATPDHKAAYQNRPLPSIPTNETPNTFLQRKLAETRAEIAHRLEQCGDGTEHFNEVLAHLDRLMVPSVYAGKRTCSAPAKSPEQIGPLHVIPEEVKSDGEDRHELYKPIHRAVTDPIRSSVQGHRAVTDSTTIRLVDQSPTRIAPLTIRKKSGKSASGRSEDGSAMAARSASAVNETTPSRAVEAIVLSSQATQAMVSVSPAEAVEKKEAIIKKKRSLWFRRAQEEKDRSQDNQLKPGASRLQIPEAWQDLDDRIKPENRDVEPVPAINDYATKHLHASASIEPHMRAHGTTANKGESGGTLKGLFGLFGKKAKEDKGKRPLELGDNFSASSILSTFDIEPDSNGEPSARSGPPDFQMNWFSRFFHIKPATKIMCFRVARGKVRKTLVNLLRDWQHFGVRDVTSDRTTNVINARVDKNNHLNIKPVTFVIELFVLLDNGHRANLCLARFTQTRGAASGFRKAAEVIEDVCRNKCMLIEEEEKKAAMCEALC